MGLNYDSGDSDRITSALSATVAAARAVLEKLEDASKRLLAALGTGELSGKGYSAVEALFAWVVLPGIARAKAEVDAIRGELDAYIREDAKISRYGVLKEDELNTQLTATKRQRDATEHLIAANSLAADSMAGVPGLSDALQLKNAQLEFVLDQLNKDIRDLEDRLTALQYFASATRGLFRDGVTNLEAAVGDAVSLMKGLSGVGVGAPAARKKALAYVTGLGPSKSWATATPGELLSLLRDLSPSQLKTMLAAHPELLQRFWDHPPSPEESAAWWNRLDATQREEWAKAVPRLVGNLDGVPPRVRSDANRGCLVADLADAKKRLADAKADSDLLSPLEGVRRLALNRLAEAEKLADTLSRIDIAYGGGPTGAPPRELYVYKPGELTKVAISTGLLDTADHISVLVPGMGTTANDIGQYGKAARHLRQQEARASGVHPTKIAVLSWLDYDPPGSMDVRGVARDDLAKAGAVRLGNALRGLTAVKDWPAKAAGLSVVAHSYGTNVATLALTEKGVTAGHLVLLGSAGVAGSIPTAAALHVPGGEVYATQGMQDEWAGIGQFASGRTDPTSPGFGARAFSAEDASLDGLDLKGITQHGPFANSPSAPESYSYFDNRTSAQYATAMATMGRGGEIPVAGTPEERGAVPRPELRPSPTPSGAGR